MRHKATTQITLKFWRIQSEIEYRETNKKWAKKAMAGKVTMISLQRMPRNKQIKEKTKGAICFISLFSDTLFFCEVMFLAFNPFKKNIAAAR